LGDRTTLQLGSAAGSGCWETRRILFGALRDVAARAFQAAPEAQALYWCCENGTPSARGTSFVAIWVNLNTGRAQIDTERKRNARKRKTPGEKQQERENNREAAHRR